MRTTFEFHFQDLKELLDDARQGIIYCSFGTDIGSKDLSVQTLSIILETFAELPYLVLWKSDLIKTPENVIVSKCLPQQDILGNKTLPKLYLKYNTGLLIY